MKKNPIISVLICARNEEEYIEKTLNSIKEQDFLLPYEIIIIDNDSNDNTGDISLKYTSKIYKCKIRGKVPSLKFGFNFTSGEIIAFADADTEYPRNWLSLIYTVFQTSSKIQLVFGSSDMGFTTKLGKKFASYLSSMQFIPSLKFGVVCSMGFNLAIKRNALEKVLVSLSSVAYSGWATGTLTCRIYGKESIEYCRRLQVPKCMRRYSENGMGKTSLNWIKEWFRLLVGKDLKLKESEYFNYD